MKVFLLLLLPFIGLSQTTRLNFFNTQVVQGEVILRWETFVEDGSDIFTIYKSQSDQNWEIVESVLSHEIRTGSLYEFNVGNLKGVWYYKLLWKDGIHYATSTIKIPNKILSQYNIIGQKLY